MTKLLSIMHMLQYFLLSNGNFPCKVRRFVTHFAFFTASPLHIESKKCRKLHFILIRLIFRRYERGRSRLVFFFKHLSHGDLLSNCTRRGACERLWRSLVWQGVGHRNLLLVPMALQIPVHVHLKLMVKIIFLI